MYSRIRSIVVCVVVICGIFIFSLCVAYRKGWDNAVMQNRIEMGESVIRLVGEKEKISAEIGKKTTPEKRKALGRYVVKG